MNTIVLFIAHKTKPGMRDAVRDVWMRNMAPAIQGNEDHLVYFYSYDLDDPNSICAFQQYSSAAAAQAFLTHPSYLHYLKEVDPLLEGPPQVKNLSPQWIKTVA